MRLTRGIWLPSHFPPPTNRGNGALHSGAPRLVSSVVSSLKARSSIHVIHARAGWRVVAGTIVLLTSLAAFQRPFREFPGSEYNDFPLPRDYQVNAEWT